MKNTISISALNSCIVSGDDISGDSCVGIHDRLVFKEILPQHLPLIQEFLTRYPSRSCDFSVGGIFMWIDYFNYNFCILNDTLFIKSDVNSFNCDLFYYPIGSMDEETSLTLIRNYCHTNRRKAMIMIPVELETGVTMPDFSSGKSLDFWTEYIYDINSFLSFAGKKMEKKRNHLNFFIKSYEFTIEEISNENKEELIAFTKNFESDHACEDIALYENEKVISTLRDYDKYNYTGILIRINGSIAGFSFGEVIGDTCFVHVEKADISYRGIYQAVSSMFSRLIHERYPQVRYLNREEDMGDESLRKSKLSYHPVMTVCKYVFPIDVSATMTDDTDADRA